MRSHCTTLVTSVFFYTIEVALYQKQIKGGMVIRTMSCRVKCISYIVLALAPSWQRVAGKLSQLDVSSSDILWGVNSIFDIYRRNGNSWTKIDGNLESKHVSVGNAGVWAVNRNDHIYFREGITDNNLDGTAWAQIDGKDFLRG